MENFDRRQNGFRKTKFPLDQNLSSRCGKAWEAWPAPQPFSRALNHTVHLSMQLVSPRNMQLVIAGISSFSDDGCLFVCGSKNLSCDGTSCVAAAATTAPGE